MQQPSPSARRTLLRRRRISNLNYQTILGSLAPSSTPSRGIYLPPLLPTAVSSLELLSDKLSLFKSTERYPHTSTMSSSHRRGPWSQNEDSYLVQLVHTQGALNWVRIAQLIGSRSPKQCRERYHQNLKPSLNHEPISPEEGLQIERMVREMGKRWAEIARRLHGRSDNAVKNWWNGSINRQRRLHIRRRTSSQHPTNFDERDQTVSFPRPVTAKTLTITSSNYSRRHFDGPLPSPAVSEVSRAESVDGAPSLISDTSSAFSISPRLAVSPTIELPPLTSSFSPDSRRPSLPSLPFRPNGFLSEDHSHSHMYAPRFHGESKPYSASALSPLYQRAELPSALSAYSPREYTFESQAQPLTAPPTPVRLPPLNLGSWQERWEQPGERDSRMTLSSVLG